MPSMTSLSFLSSHELKKMLLFLRDTSSHSGVHQLWVDQGLLTILLYQHDNVWLVWSLVSTDVNKNTVHPIFEKDRNTVGSTLKIANWDKSAQYSSHKKYSCYNREQLLTIASFSEREILINFCDFNVTSLMWIYSSRIR